MSNYNKITALYSRLSVGDEDRDGGESNSIQNQKIFLENYAKRSSHYTIALEEIETYVADTHTVEAEIEAKELARIIESFLDTLTTENRVIFMRRYWFSDSYKDIAEVVGLSEKNVSVRLTRIREKMKQYLIEREVFI